MTTPIKALFFDWNGTCSDIRNVNREEWSRAMRKTEGGVYRSMTERVGKYLAERLATAPPHPDIAMLSVLRRPLVVLTNNDREMMKVALASPLAASVGFKLHSADDSSAYKPDRRMYLDANHAQSLSPVESLMVAAHNFDLKAARKLGMKTCFVRRAGEDVSDGGWDYEVDDFYQLAKLLTATE